MTPSPKPWLVEVEHALGPGVDFARVPGSGLVGQRVRQGGVWLGYDRAGLVDSDDGRGARVPVIVALPTSTFDGARLAVQLTGGWRTADGLVLVAEVPGAPATASVAGRVAAGVDADARRLGRDAAVREAHRARQRYRERRSHDRISGGRAWRASDGLAPETARFATPHSAAEYRLDRLPPRFVRGLDGLLDDDERLLYWVERPQGGDVTLARRLRGRVDRRAALLVLTDRQLLWLVDHAPPDSYGHDWGVDIELVPVERIREVRCSPQGDTGLTVVTPSGVRTYVLPVELREEVDLMRTLLNRFMPRGGSTLPSRTYPAQAIPFDIETAARFGQQAEAEALVRAAHERGEVLAMLFNPRRPGQREPAALILRPATVELLGRAHSRAQSLADVTAITLTLSALVGRIGFEPGIRTTYPAPLMDRAAAFVRLARRVLAGRS